MTSLALITSTCEPRPDVLSGGLTDAHFAAQLDQVVRSPEKYPVYGDPTEFFAITFPTTGLRDLLSSTFGRLSGRAGHVEGAEHGVVRFQTSFGGGKTHGLIAAYHLAVGARPIGVEEFVDPDLLPDDCSVAAVVGDSLDALSGLDVNGHRVLTMWGAIAAQLGDKAWEAMAAHDAERSAPGTAIWADIFEDAPKLVIIDEIAAHLRALSSSGSEDLRRQAEAVPAFLYDLFTAAARVDSARVIITLATAQDAFGAETSAIEKTLNDATGAAADTKSVIGRFREILVPAADEEIAEILRRRLFARIDTDAAEAAGAAFREFYGEVERREIQLGFDADIAGQVARSYPLHPELVKVLDSRVGTIPEFQRTRGALRLLAETVAALWDKKTTAVVINVADLPLDASPVSAALTRGIGREEFAPVVDADIAGSQSHAAAIDRSRFPGATPYATRAASAVFLHSLERTAATGATVVDVWRGTLAPGDDPDLVEEALRLLDQSAWHLSYDTSRYRFQTEPNPRKIVGDEKAAVLASVVREELDHRIGVMFASAGPVKVKIFPHGPYDVDDKPELRLAVVHYDDLTVDARTASPTPLQLADMLDQFGVAGVNRTYRNGIVFLVADTGQVDAMRETVRYHLAAQRIVSDGQRMAGYAEEVQKKLRAIADKAGLDARVAITRCLRHLYYPKADKANHHLRHHELSPSAQGDQEKNQTPVIQSVLEGIGKIRTTPISTDFLASVAGFPATNPMPTTQAVEGFWRNHDADLVVNPTIIIDAIVAGIRNGSWVYYDADTEKAYTSESPPPASRIAATTFLYTFEKAEADGLLKREPTWEDINQALKAHPAVSGTDLRSALEVALGSEPTKGTVLGILSRVVRQEDAPIVVVDGEPSADSVPLAPLSVERMSLDRLTILTRTKATELGIQLKEARSGFRLEQSGLAGQVFATLADKLAELGTEKQINHAEIQMTVAGVDTSALRTLLSVVPMLPRHEFTVRMLGAATFDGLSGDVSVSRLTGLSKDFRKVEKTIMDLWDKAADLTVDIALIYSPPEPVDPTAAEWSALSSTIVDVKPGLLTVEVRGQ